MLEGSSPCRNRFLPSSAPMSSLWPVRAGPRCARSRKTSASRRPCLHRWLKIADQDGGGRPASKAATDDVSAQLREAHRRIKLLEQEAEVMRRAVGYLSRDANPK